MSEAPQNAPATMRCVEITSPGGPEVLTPSTRATPIPEHDEILIRVAAAGVNRPDVLQRAGAYDPPPGASDLPGLEAAGVVVAVGAGAARWRVGDNVTALTPGGAYAEYVTTPAAHALPIPNGLSVMEAAALPETTFTVWVNLFDRVGLDAGETVLVHGGSSGIGTIAIQLAAARGARVFATAGSDEKCAACLDLGAEVAINYRNDDFVEATRAATAGRGVDVVLDMVGGDYVNRNIKAAAVDGRISNIAFLNGGRVEANLQLAMVKRLTWTGSTLRPRSVGYKARMAEALEREVWPLIAAGRVRPLVNAQFPLEAAAEAHRLMERSDHIGKIMLSVTGA